MRLTEPQNSFTWDEARELVMRVQAGDPEAEEAFTHRFRPMIQKIARTINCTHLGFDDNDKVSLALMHLMTGSRSPLSKWLEGRKTNLRRYVAVTVRHYLLDLLDRKKDAMDLQVYAEENKESIFLCIASDYTAQDVQVYQNERNHAVHIVLASISAEARRILRFSYFKGMTDVEISENLNLPESTVRNRRIKAEEVFRRKFKSRFKSLVENGF